MSKFLSARFIYLLVALVFFVASQYQLFYEFRGLTEVEGKSLFVSGYYPQDYFGYLAYIEQGIAGSLGKYEVFMSDKSPTTLIHGFYPLIGFLSRNISTDTIFIYHFFQCIGAILVLYGIYFFMATILGVASGSVGALLAITIACIPFQNFPKMTVYDSILGGVQWWWAESMIGRLTQPPHYVFGYAAFLFGLRYFFLFLKSRKYISFLSAILLLGFGSFAYPPLLLPIVAVVLLCTIGSVYQSVSDKKITAQSIGSGFVLLCMVVFFIVMKHEESKLVGFVQSSNWEARYWNFHPEIFRAAPFVYGILPLFAMPASIFAIWKKKYTMLIWSMWALLPFIVMPFATKFELPINRLFTILGQIPTAILVTWFVYQIPKNRIRIFILAFLILLGIFTSGMLFFVHKHHIEFLGQTTYYYQTGSEARARSALANMVKPKEVLLASHRIGNRFPAFMPILSYIGHSVNTINFDSKMAELIHFFHGDYSEIQASEYLSRTHTNYVYQGEDEMGLGQNYSVLPYKSLQLIYDTPTIRIYKVVSS